MRRLLSTLALIAGAWASTSVLAQVRPMDRPEPVQAVTRLLEAPYLSEEERKDLRIFHGCWKGSDLDTPARLARASLVSGVYDDPSFDSPDADALDRAEAMAARGDLDEALALLRDNAAPRALRLRAEALFAKGRHAEAIAAAEPLLTQLASGALTTAPDLTDGVRALRLRTLIVGPGGKGAAAGVDHQAMMSILARVRDNIDRMYWPAQLLEAQLLAEKDNPKEAQEALAHVLELNPACARGWHMLGEFAVAGFDIGAGDSIAARLDTIAYASGRSADEAPDSPDVDHPSALGAIVRTRGLLRLTDTDAAAEAIDPILARHPRMREALALRAAVAARAYDDAKTAEMLAKFEALSPGSPLALYEVGRVMSEARQYAIAADYLNKAHDRLPSWPDPLIDLGLLEVQSGRDDRAFTALSAAADLDPFNVRASNSLKLVQELRAYDQVESDHFIVRFKPGVDGVMAREMLAPLESNYRTVTGNGPGGIEYIPTSGFGDGGRKTVIDLMPDHRWFGVRIAGLPKIHTIAASTGPVIAMEAPRDGKDHLGTYDWVRVVRHEFTHTVTLARTNNRIPHWFTEAAAVYLELSPRDYSTCRLLADALRADALFDFTAINVAFVRPAKPTDRSLAYAQGHWMYQYMVETFGREAPLKLMDLYAQGVREEAAFRSVLGLSREEFFDRFSAWAKEQVVSWGLAPKPGRPTIQQLVKADSAGTEAPTSEKPGAADALNPKAGKPAPQDDQPRAERTIDRDKVAAWLKQYPDHPDLLEMAVDMDITAAGGNATADLVPLLEAYAKARPVDPAPHKLLSKFFLAGGAVEGSPVSGPAAAIPHLEYLDAREQKSPAFAAELARRYSAQDQWDLAAAKAERATQIAPYDASLRELAASIAVKHRDFDVAERHLTALTILEPDRPVHAKRLEALKALRENR